MTYILLIVSSAIAGWLARDFFNKRVSGIANQENRQPTDQATHQPAQTRERTTDDKININTRKQSEAEKIPLTIAGLAEMATDKGYNLFLDYDNTEKLCMSIGHVEAQTIALEIKNIKPDRPLTFDLLQTLLLASHFTVKEIIIDALVDQIFYATVVLQSREGEVELDARPSDALVIALKNNAPIYIYKNVLQAYRNR